MGVARAIARAIARTHTGVHSAYGTFQEMCLNLFKLAKASVLKSDFETSMMVPLVTKFAKSHFITSARSPCVNAYPGSVL